MSAHASGDDLPVGLRLGGGLRTGHLERLTNTDELLGRLSKRWALREVLERVERVIELTCAHDIEERARLAWGLHGLA